MSTTQNTASELALQPETCTEFEQSLNALKEMLGQIAENCPSELNAEMQNNTILGEIANQIRDINEILEGFTQESLPEGEISAAIYHRMVQILGERQLTVDPILQLALANHCGCQEAIKGRALSQVLKQALAHSGIYQRGLGDWFPQQFQNELGYQVKVQNFDTCSGTALDDLHVFLTTLDDPSSLSDNLMVGFPQLDAALHGLPPLTILGGVPGVGKSCLALQMAWQALEQDPQLAVVFLSLDMPKRDIYNRLYCQITGLEYREFAAQQFSDLADLYHGFQSSPRGLERLRIIDRSWVVIQQRDRKVCVDYHGEPLPPRTQVWNLLRRIQSQLHSFRQETGAEKLLVVIDYLQLLPGGAGQQELDQDLAQLEAIRFLQELANTRYLVVSEVRKANRNNGVLTLEDLRGHSRLGYQADAVLLVYDDPENRNPPDGCRPLQLNIAKGRAGTERITLPLTFEYRRQSFRESESPTSVAGETPNTDLAHAGY